MLLRKKNLPLIYYLYSGLALKCVVNGEPPESKDAEPTKFEAKNVDCETDMCSTSAKTGKVIHPKYYKLLKKGAPQSHLDGQKMGWFLAY